MRKPVFGHFFDTKQAAQPLKIARGLQFWIWEEEGLYCLCTENKGADQLCCYGKLICCFVFAYAKSLFSHDAAHIFMCIIVLFYHNVLIVL